MREYLRMANVSADSGEGTPIHDFHLSIHTGEILFLTGIHWSGKPTVKQLLRGRTDITKGSLYVDEAPYSYSNFSLENTVCVDTVSCFCKVLTIQENLFSLQRESNYLDLNRGRRFRRETRALLEWAGISRSPDTLVGDLTGLEQALLWFALAKKKGARLFLFDCVGASYSYQDMQVLGKALQKLKAEEIAVVVLHEHPNELMAQADRVAVLKQGTVGKILYPGEISETTVLQYLTGYDGLQLSYKGSGQPGEPGELLEEVQSGSEAEPIALRQKQIIGIYDASWGKKETMPLYLSRFFAENGYMRPEFLGWKDTIYIPEHSGECLFSSLDIGSNIAMVAYRRMGPFMGILKPGVKLFLQREFFEKFMVDSDTERVSELTCREKKLLSVYRWSLTRPRVMLLEDPMMRISLEDRAAFKEYLREVADEGCCLLVSSKELNNLMDFCDGLLLVRDKKLQRILQFNV